jgi:hypothetical protein
MQIQDVTIAPVVNDVKTIHLFRLVYNTTLKKLYIIGHILFIRLFRRKNLRTQKFNGVPLSQGELCT